jgi:DNA invertase Pin-like site-specific DNA recombinase
MRPLVNDTDDDVAKRRQAMTEHVQRVLLPLGYTHGGIHVDAADTANVQLTERPQGRNLNLGLERGDHVVIDRLEAFRNARDWWATASLWRNRGVTFDVLAVRGLSTLGDTSEAVFQVVQLLAGAHRTWLADRCRRGHRTRRRSGKLANGSCGPGYRLAGHRGHRRKVVDEDERAVMRKIVQWRDKGATFRLLYFHLLKHRIRRSNGHEWSENAIRRAYYREVGLRQEEAMATPAGPDADAEPPETTTPPLAS